MERNVGDLDRAFRISVAIVLLAMGLIYNQTLLFIPAFILLLTGFLGTCPIYSIFGWSTKTYFDYPSASIPQAPMAVEVEERTIIEEPAPQDREARRKELFEEPEEEPVVEEKPTTRRRKRRNVRRKTKAKKED
ncbi:MAG: DUF2892 domain-containing protein [Candidatus Micrarchaeota archaeon]|nr:DUF2892 domain-containing protein [Candidatus Micrarchaeota archaeon]